MKNYLIVAIILFSSKLFSNGGDDDLKKALDAFKKDDFKTAFGHFKVSAEKGNLESTFFMGRLYSRGFGIKKDKGEAEKYYNLCLNGGEALGYFGLAELQPEKSTKESEYYEKAKSRVEEKAKGNNFFWQRALSLYHLNGKGNTPKDKNLFYEYAIKASNNGYGTAMSDIHDEIKEIDAYRLESINQFKSNEKIVKASFQKQKAFLLQLASWNGCASADYAIGEEYEKDKYFAAALLYYLAAGKKFGTFSNAGVQSAVWLLMKNNSVKNLKAAYELNKKAAREDAAFGYYNLGIMYEEGLYVFQDFDKAVENYEKAGSLNPMSRAVDRGAVINILRGVNVAENKLKLKKRASQKTGQAEYFLKVFDLADKSGFCARTSKLEVFPLYDTTKIFYGIPSDYKRVNALKFKVKYNYEGASKIRIYPGDFPPNYSSYGPCPDLPSSGTHETYIATNTPGIWCGILQIYMSANGSKKPSEDLGSGLIAHIPVLQLATMQSYNGESVKNSQFEQDLSDKASPLEYLDEASLLKMAFNLGVDDISGLHIEGNTFGESPIGLAQEIKNGIEKAAVNKKLRFPDCAKQENWTNSIRTITLNNRVSLKVPAQIEFTDYHLAREDFNPGGEVLGFASTLNYESNGNKYLVWFSFSDPATEKDAPSGFSRSVADALMAIWNGTNKKEGEIDLDNGTNKIADKSVNGYEYNVTAFRKSKGTQCLWARSAKIEGKRTKYNFTTFVFKVSSNEKKNWNDDTKQEEDQYFNFITEALVNSFKEM